jgi:hypothetical protein
MEFFKIGGRPALNERLSRPSWGCFQIGRRMAFPALNGLHGISGAWRAP